MKISKDRELKLYRDILELSKKAISREELIARLRERGWRIAKG